MRLTPKAIRLLTHSDEIVRWHNVELPKVRGTRVDLLGETAAGKLVQIDLQSTNHPDMAVRMLDYSVGIRQIYGKFPSQVVLYAGQRRLRMPSRIKETDLDFRFRLFDIREVPSEAFLKSSRLDDNVIAILTRVTDPRGTLRLILGKIVDGDPEHRGQALAELAMLSGLRNLGSLLVQETKSMPILNDIMDHELFGPKIREGIAIGLEKGREQGERDIVRRQIAKRFGPIPAWATNRLDAMSLAEIDNVALRLLDVSGLEQLLT